MPSLKDLKIRITSVKSTRKITKAMQMVAASKMRKAQQAALAARPFARLLYRIQRSATRKAYHFGHALLEVREVRRRAVILIAGDKGLCGALNTNVFRLAAQFDPQSTVYIAAGRKAAQFVARTKRHLAAEFAYGDAPAFREARAIAAFARDLARAARLETLHDDRLHARTRPVDRRRVAGRSGTDNQHAGGVGSHANVPSESSRLRWGVLS